MDLAVKEDYRRLCIATKLMNKEEEIYEKIKEMRRLDMILYATKQTIEDLNIPMIEELSQFNKTMAQKVIEEQSNDKLLEWGLKIFYFDNRKCVQAINYASKLTIFLFDIKEEEIAYIANGIAIYLMDIYEKDKNMLENYY